MPQQFQIIASVYRHLIEILRQENLRISEISAHIGADIEALRASQEMLSLEQVTALWELGYRVRGARIGIDVARGVRLVDYQDVGVFLTATENVADMLRQLQNYCALFSNVVEFHVNECAQGLEASLHYHASVPLLHERLEFLAASGPVLISQYLDSPLRLLCAELPRPMPTDPSPWNETFGVEVGWNASQARFVIASEEAKRSVLTRNEHLRRELQFLLDRRLSRHRQTHPLDDIRAVAVEQLGQQVPCIESVAEALHISPRTLQRRLADADSSFSDLLSSLRQDLAQRYIREGIPLGDVAERLGYSDAQTFNRAFKRWLGRTPAQYRESQN